MGGRSGSSQPHSIRNIFVASASLLILLAAGCIRPSRPDPQSSDLPVFVAPTIVVIQAVTPGSNLPTQPIPTAAPTSSLNSPDCVDDFTFINDLNYPDGTEVSHASIIQKQWIVQNSGTCTWTSGYTIRNVDGPAMSANPSQALTSAVPGSQVTIAITFIAPTQPGEYKSSWQAFNPSGQSFSKSLWIDIIVTP
jgi:hypothetical protein